ncbi:MAG: hypothetical protein ACOVO2_20610 [Emticicia sp.]|uniref:hypothetical protein n=1 Tax=Emticicia sp. TaxID=1930953 RepID=UPI003BA602FA
MLQKSEKLLLIALFVGLVFHGTIFFFTFDETYDAFVHIFFADHYARSWFEPWDNRWYTGFNVTSYPPLVHQLTALLSFVFGLRYGFVILAICAVQLLIIGAYRFSKLWTTPRAAGYAAIFTCFASSIIEALHLFGQVPTLMGISCLLNALPEIYRWIRYGKYYRLATALSIMAMGVTSHHVTTIFGMVFFVAPVIGLAVLDSKIEKNKAENQNDSGRTLTVPKVFSNDTLPIKITILDFIKETWLKRKQIILFGMAVPFVMLFVFPYFYWSKTDPITQVSIPHGSRDSFIEVPSSGLMFFLIPLGIDLLLLPYVFSRVWTKRNIFIGFSFSLLLLFGTGGTTPIPKLMLGENAFNILTLDRFTFWATMIAIPFIGEFFYRLIEGDFRLFLRSKIGVWPYRLIWGFIVLGCITLVIFIINLGSFRPLQPATIDTTPIIQFLERDQHDKWRFMTLGFGDQMAWLSAQTTAQSVDGNYHSARRLPEMTTRPLERLENSKFKGIQGLGSLQQFLTIPEKYYLKFIFSNDKFYDPILYFSGWERVQRLENGIMVWQKQDIPPLPSVLPEKKLPKFVKIYWGVMPVLALLLAFSINLLFVWYARFKKIKAYEDGYEKAVLTLPPIKKRLFIFMGMWIFTLSTIIITVYLQMMLSSPNDSPSKVVTSYYDAIDFKDFKTAYEYFNPKTRTSFDDYFIKLSVEDGILASYAKLDNLKIEEKKIDDNTYELKAIAEWITPVEQYFTENIHKAVRYNGEWYIEQPKFDPTTPADTFIDEAFLSMHGHGKRKAGVEPTAHEDILDRPELKILNARMIKLDSTYVVIGELQNIDNQPAHITIQANLFDEYNRRLVSYNAKYITIHRIMPKETIPFRIEFEETAWVKKDDLDPAKFNPKEFTNFNFKIPPKLFNLMVRGVVDKNDIYRSAGIQSVREEGDKLMGEVINYGTEEISVPKLLIAYYDKNDQIKWVDTHFLRYGVRQQRRRGFVIEPTIPKNYKEVYIGTDENFFVNGLSNNSFHAPTQTKTLKNRIKLKNSGSISIRVDAFVGNPTIY